MLMQEDKKKQVDGERLKEKMSMDEAARFI
jgi:hypothetical protein